MDLEKAIGFAETYVRQYVAYLLAFFGESVDPAQEAEAPDPFKTVLIFSLISAFLGTSFAWHAVSGEFADSKTIAERMSLQFAYWLALAIFLLLVLSIMRTGVRMMTAILIVFSVTPVAYVIGGYAGFLWQYVARLWQPTWTASRVEAYWAIVLVQFAISGIYFPAYIYRLAAMDRVRTAVSASLLLLLIALVQIFFFVATRGPGGA